MVLVKEPLQDNDVTLVESCRNGDSTAFDELVRRYKDRVYHVAYRFLGNHEDAQDATQEAFVRAYQGIHTFRGSARVYTWLYSIVGNVSRNRLRDRSRKGRNKGTSLESLEEANPAVARSALASTHDPAAEAQRNEMEGLLQECLMELPEHYRLVFVLRTVDQLSYDEIAESVGCPKGTVKSRLNQARKMLHEKLAMRGAV